jgi:hypothetical protein
MTAILACLALQVLAALAARTVALPFLLGHFEMLMNIRHKH